MLFVDLLFGYFMLFCYFRGTIWVYIISQYPLLSLPMRFNLFCFFSLERSLSIVLSETDNSFDNSIADTVLFSFISAAVFFNVFCKIKSFRNKLISAFELGNYASRGLLICLFVELGFV